MSKKPDLFARFALDYADHPKILALSDSAFRAHVTLILYSRKYKTDGIIKNPVANRLGLQWDTDVLAELQNNDPDAPSLQKLENGDYYLTGYEEMQETRAEIDARRRRNAENGRKGGRPPKNPRNPKITHSVTDPPTQSGTQKKAETETETELKELPKGSSKKSTATRIPDGWEPAKRVIDDLTQKHPTVAIFYEYQKFCDYWRAESGAKARKHDWDATFRNWVRRADENQKNRPQQFLTGAEKRAQQSMAHIQAMTNYQPTNPFEQGALKQIDTPRSRELSGDDQPA